MTARSRGKVKTKPCRQKDTCPFYGSCKYGHDSNKCRMSFGQDTDEILEID